MLKNLRGTDAKIDSRTIAARFAHPQAWRWVHCQQWSWDGGDAIIVPTGKHLDGPTYAFIRIGDTVKTIQANCFNDALRWLGIDPTPEKSPDSAEGP